MKNFEKNAQLKDDIKRIHPELLVYRSVAQISKNYCTKKAAVLEYIQPNSATEDFCRLNHRGDPLNHFCEPD